MPEFVKKKQIVIGLIPKQLIVQRFTKDVFLQFEFAKNEIDKYLGNSPFKNNCLFQTSLSPDPMSKFGE